MAQRLDFGTQSPALLKRFIQLSSALQQSTLEERLRDLVAIRASQINGCDFCADMHVTDDIATWRESTLFSKRERAALAWTEVLTRLSEQGVPGEIYQRVRTQLSANEIADLTFVVTLIHSWNRMTIGLETVPGSSDARLGPDNSNLTPAMCDPK